jgi:hypothetical protein
MTEKLTYGLEDSAAILGISEACLLKMAEKGYIPAIKKNGDSEYEFDNRDVIYFAENRDLVLHSIYKFGEDTRSEPVELTVTKLLSDFKIFDDRLLGEVDVLTSLEFFLDTILNAHNSGIRVVK